MRPPSASEMLRVAPAVLLGGSAIALLLPLALHALLPPSKPGWSMDDAWVLLTLGWWLCGVLALLGLVALGVLVAREPHAGLRQATVVALVGVLVAGAFALPYHDRAVRAAALERYAEDGPFVVPDHGVQLGGVHDRGGEGVAFVWRGGAEAHEGVLEVGPFPVTKGDLWQLGVHLSATRWEGFEPPLVVAGGVACAPSVHLDYFGAAEPGHGSVYLCSAERTGEVAVSIDPRAPGPVGLDVHMAALATQYAGFWRMLDEAFVVLGSAVALVAVGLKGSYRQGGAPTTLRSTQQKHF